MTRPPLYMCDECGVCAHPCSDCPPDMFEHSRPISGPLPDPTADRWPNLPPTPPEDQ